jgi:hypothetical protein
MKGADKIFIHGEEIARAKDVAQSKQEVMNTLFQEDANIRNEFNNRIDNIPVIYPQDLVDNGFDYSYRSTSETNNVIITVEPYGSGLGFTQQEDGWYRADNLGVDNSYAMAKIVFNNTSDTDKPVLLDLSQNAEQGYDYFVVSVLNAPLDDSLEDMSNVQDIFNNMGEFNIGVVFDVPPGINYKIIKFRKDGSGAVENERAYFRAQEEQPLIIERRHMATEEYVNSIVGNVNTELESIINGEV